MTEAEWWKILRIKLKKEQIQQKPLNVEQEFEVFSDWLEDQCDELCETIRWWVKQGRWPNWESPGNIEITPKPKRVWTWYSHPEYIGTNRLEPEVFGQLTNGLNKSTKSLDRDYLTLEDALRALHRARSQT